MGVCVMGNEDVITKELCSLITDNSVMCHGEPTWQLHSTERCMYVCDAHLANGLRQCGLPALVDQHVASHKKMGHK
jgi:hypothetical protein